ncbi:MAG: dienelactone hydrolase family protein [Alcanivoracaceae bacterium]|nr:dienelactone hydrolase family protein [Alcanivoracaceae bacterium]
MKLAHWIAALCLLMSVPSLAAVKERQVALPDNLGTAVLYTAKGKKAGPGVIVVHEWWGLNDYARDRARQLAEAGYSAIAVDMYGHGKVANHPKDANAFMEAAFAEPDKMNARFDAARAVLAAEANVDNARIYAVGYCFGGAVVLNQARMGADLAGVASFHGSLGSKKPATEDSVKARVLVATGGADPMVPAQQVGQFVTEMSSAGVDLQLFSFPNVLHGFTNPDATEVGKQFDMPLAYDEAADRTSWQALMKFIR